MTRMMALCFFGITRSLSHTVASIEKNIISPAQHIGAVKVYSHFFIQSDVVNPRSGEIGKVDPEEYRLLPNDWISLEQPDLCLAEWDFDALKSYGDIWNDDFRSLRNLVHQQHSLHKVTFQALKDGADICLFFRPDLYYHDNLGGPMRRAMRARGDLVQLPYWQPHTGLNDRFALCSGRAAIRAYGTRLELARQYCQDTSGPLHSERLVQYALQRAGIKVREIGARATRVRIDGKYRYEDFLPPTLSHMRKEFRRYLLSGFK